VIEESMSAPNGKCPPPMKLSMRRIFYWLPFKFS